LKRFIKHHCYNHQLSYWKETAEVAGLSDYIIKSKGKLEDFAYYIRECTKKYEFLGYETLGKQK